MPYFKVELIVRERRWYVVEAESAEVAEEAALTDAETPGYSYDLESTNVEDVRLHKTTDVTEKYAGKAPVRPWPASEEVK